MENRCADLFRVILTLNCFVVFLSFTGVTSAPTSTSSIIDIMRNDSKICPTSKFLYDSEYTKSCASVKYPTTPWNYSSETLNNFLCLGVYDTAYKICQYSSQLPISFSNSFNSYMEKYVPNENIAQEDFCKSLQGFTSLYNKINDLWKRLVESLNIPHKCIKICYDLQDKFHPLCAMIAWIKNIDDNIKSAKTIETKHNITMTDNSYVTQLKDGILTDKTVIESEKIEIKNSKEQNKKPITINSNNSNNVKGDNSNISDNTPSANVKYDKEKTKSDIQKVNNVQKKNNTLEIQIDHKSMLNENKENININTEVPKTVKNIPANGDSQPPSLNKATNNKNKIVENEENAEKINKDQDNDDIKPSTLSENTQEHYDALNPNENMDNDINDVDDTIQHPDTGNQNENVQENLEEKNNNGRLTEYSNMRTEDDSHFFTYFTVITLTCLVGYIGYHNKQKILAIVLEGRRSRNNRSRRRPSTASYRKLDCTLEEAVTSQCNANVTHVIY